MLTPGTLRRWLPAVSTALVLLVIGGLALSNPAGGGRLRRWVFDSFQQQKPRSPSQLPVRVVDIDEASLNRLGQWPWSRDRMADLLNALRLAGSQLVVLDIILSEPDRTTPARALADWSDDPAVRAALTGLPDYDESLAGAISEMPVVLGFALTNEEPARRPADSKAAIVLQNVEEPLRVPTFSSVTPPLALFETVARGSAAVNSTLDGDGVIRHVPTVLSAQGRLYPSLAAEAARVYLGGKSFLVRGHRTADGVGADLESVTLGPRTVATDAGGHMWLYHSLIDRSRSLPAWRVLAGESKEDLRDALVVIGSSAPGLHDLRLTPLQKDRILGAEIQAQAIEQIIDGTFLHRPAWSFALELIVMLFSWGVVTAAVLRLGAFAAAAAAAALCTGLVASSWLAFSRSLWVVDPVWPVLCTAATFVVGSVARWMVDEADKRWVRRAFSSYISPNLVDYLIAHPEALELGGVRRQCSFVASDLANFSRLVETTAPADAVAILNEYVAGMTQVVLEHGGTIDRVVGDAVAAMFSAPVEQADHPRRALDCALEMQRFSDDFRRRQEELGRNVDLTRIGVHCGPVTVGNVGGDALVDYRALGNAVNMAARLETANKVLGTRTCVSGEIVDAVDGFVGRPVGELLLAGRTGSLAAFEPLTPQQAATPAAQAYLEAYAALEAGDDNAGSLLRRVLALAPQDPLAGLHLERLERGETGVTIDTLSAARRAPAVSG